MASISNLSDSEIREHLIKLKLPVVPITDSTRNILLKKIETALSGTNSRGSTPRRSPSRSRSNSSVVENVVSPKTNGFTDDEIKQNLVKYNLPQVPITDATRSLLIKKIQSAIDSNGKTSSKAPSRSTNSFVDHDTSDMLPPSSVPSSRRKSRSGLDSPRPMSPSRRGNVTSNSFLDQSIDDLNSSTVSRRRGRPVTSQLNGFETGSDSDAPEKPSTSLSNRKKTSPGNRSFNKSPIFPSVFSNLPTSVRTGDLSPPSRPVTPAVRSGHDTFDFARKPLSGYSTRFNNSNNSGNSYIKESDEDEYSPRLPKRYLSSSTNTIANHNKQSVKKSPKLSKYLVGSVVVFFLCIGFLYFTIRTDSSLMFDIENTKCPICGTGKIEPGVTCVMDKDIPTAIEFLPYIYDELRERSISKHCGYPSTEDKLNEQDITKLLTEKSPTISDWDLRTHVPNIKVLINSNPQWSLKVLDDKIVLSKIDLPITCSISSFFAKLVYYCIHCAFLLVGVFASYKGIKYYLDRKQKAQRQVLKMVDDILQLIRLQAEKNPEEPYLPIRHVEDQLIPLYERDNLNKVWLSVRKFLENEARIRQEIQMVQGEDQDVWRWLPPQPMVSRKNKTWQGAAFETEEGSVNALPVSPTACLKIRSMFDPKDEDMSDSKWITNVQDAILEKCEGISILHIGVEKSSPEGIVFMKCASCTDAGKAYKALHGSWFNSKLVTVKYLRYERYHERFPEAKAVVAPLKPSNDKKLSLQ